MNKDSPPTDDGTAEKRDAALRRALNTPPKPKTSDKSDKSQSEKENGKKAKR